MVPGNGGDGIDDALFGTLFGLAILGIDLNSAPDAVRNTFLLGISNFKLSSNRFMKEHGETKKETSLVFGSYHL